MDGLLNSVANEPEQPQQASGGESPLTEQQAQVAAQARDAALEVLYGDEKTFGDMIAMFRTAKSPADFAQAMSTIVNGVMEAVEQRIGKMDPAITQGVGYGMIMKVFGDLIEGGMVQENEELLIASAAKTLEDWMNRNPDRVRPEDYARSASTSERGSRAAGIDPAAIEQQAQQEQVPVQPQGGMLNEMR